MNESNKLIHLENEIKKLKYHISMLNTFEVYESNPIGSLVVSFDWSEKDLEKAHDIFEKYDNKLSQEKKIDGLYSLIEHDFQVEFGINYQRVKAIVLAFFRNNQWINVCIEFVKSQGDMYPIEFSEIVSYIKENNL